MNDILGTDQATRLFSHIFFSNLADIFTNTNRWCIDREQIIDRLVCLLQFWSKIINLLNQSSFNALQMDDLHFAISSFYLSPCLGPVLLCFYLLPKPLFSSCILCLLFPSPATLLLFASDSRFSAILFSLFPLYWPFPSFFSNTSPVSI